MSLLVIGGGPAGAAAAITARQAGFDVTVLDEAQFPRFRPGETLHPGIEPLLEQLGAHQPVRDAGYLRHSGTWVRWGSRNEFVPFGSDADGPWHGFQAPREDFDRRLLAVARQMGATVHEGCAAQSLITEDGRVIGVHTRAGPLYARFTLDASGGQHWLARRLGVAIKRHSPRLIARYGYIDAAPSEPEKLPRIEADANGWTWIAGLGCGRYLWTRVSEPDQRPASTWTPDDWPPHTSSCVSRGSDVTWRIAAETAGPGWFLCGDAAAVVDPSSSHGVLRAIMSGIMAAHLATAVLADRTPVESAVLAYQGWLSDWFRHDADAMSEAYREAGLFRHQR